ncbi:hypothetical protein [Hyalangium versicolor]|uniref:hypothetical protein n=1 Tax=Hyalangium versicolor TaxID=2861190 RepID=UPI001CCFC548|nr:hypothetical protein [Hyalangium versicolor]
MSTQEARERLAEAQAALVRALAQGAPVPEGFDSKRVQETARSLISKRRRWVERSWPRLAAGLGDSFRPRFEAWARENPMELETSALADGRKFADALLATAEYPDSAREELFFFELRYLLSEHGLSERKGLTLKVLKVDRSRLLAARLPGGRVLQLRLPF